MSRPKYINIRHKCSCPCVLKVGHWSFDHYFSHGYMACKFASWESGYPSQKSCLLTGKRLIPKGEKWKNQDGRIIYRDTWWYSKKLKGAQGL